MPPDPIHLPTVIGVIALMVGCLWWLHTHPPDDGDDL